MDFKTPVLSLLKEASSKLPGDVIDVIRDMQSKEDKDGNSYSVLSSILKNIDLASSGSLPICQDTGMIFMVIYYPVGFSTLEIRSSIVSAIKDATELNYLRPNTVSIITGNNPGDNSGEGVPSLYFKEWEKDYFEFRLMLKGGGSENVGIQYKLPDSSLKAGRDLEGVKRCVLEGVFKAQGLGCAPGILGIGIGGDRGSSYYLSKVQLFRKLGESSPVPEIAELEEDILVSANKLGIGPMGFGGQTTLLGVKIGDYYRHPATYYVTITYLCWAARRKIMILRQDGGYDID